MFPYSGAEYYISLKLTFWRAWLSMLNFRLGLIQQPQFANSDPELALSTQISREKWLYYFCVSDHVSAIADARYLGSQQI